MKRRVLRQIRDERLELDLPRGHWNDSPALALFLVACLVGVAVACWAYLWRTL